LISFFFKILFSSQLSKCFDILPKGVVTEFFMGKEVDYDVVFTTFSTKVPNPPIPQFSNL